LGLTLSACGSDKSGSDEKTFVYNAAGASAPFQEALEGSFMASFEDESGLQTAIDPFCCGVDKLKAAEASDNVPWDVVQWVTNADYELAKEQGLLQPLDTDVVPVDLLEPGTYDEYGYQVFTSAVLLAWQPGTYSEGEQPTSIKDIFDTDRFPGKRCMYQGISFGGTFESALLAADVPASDLYPLDLDTAFDELDAIKDDIVWWKSGAEAAQNLLDGTCQLGLIWNGVAQSTVNSGNDLEVTWGDAITVYGMNTIPKGSPNPDAAQDFLALMLTDTDAQADFYSKTAYTTPLQDPPSLAEEVALWAPQGENLASAIKEDSPYYAENSEEITNAFNDWLATS
jgi:putative spermidine/putrescine transport system substrate-binding protein